MGIVDHAKEEFRMAGWLDEPVCEMQQLVMDNLIELLEVFAKQGHSGSSAPYVINLFKRLASFEIIAPLTGEDSEWMEVGEGVFQNKRYSSVFKDESGCYDIDRWIFEDEHGGSYTNKNSRGYIENFPYTPVSEVVREIKPTSEDN